MLTSTLFLLNFPWHLEQIGFNSTLSSSSRYPGLGLDKEHHQRAHACAVCWVAYSSSRVWLFASPWTVAHQAPLSMGFSRQEYWSGLPCPSPGDLPNPGIKPTSLMSPALAGRFFTTSATWEAQKGPWMVPINLTYVNISILYVSLSLSVCARVYVCAGMILLVFTQHENLLKLSLRVPQHYKHSHFFTPSLHLPSASHHHLGIAFTWLSVSCFGCCYWFHTCLLELTPGYGYSLV